MELDYLFERKRNLEEEINNFFNNGEIINYGDRNYQSLLEKLDDVNEQIQEIININ